MSVSDFPFEFDEVCVARDITTIDPDNPFDINDVGPNARKYLQGINCKCVLVPGNCICIPTQGGLLLSEKNRLDLFAAFCKIMDRNTQFDITLRLMANSKKLNEAENMLSTEDFLQLLKDVRVSGKMALGKSYESYINLLHQSGASQSRFINELIQNADDCDYPVDVVPHMVIKTSGKTLEIQYNETGFTRHNVRAITAIGESTKKRLLSGQTLTKDTIGEKGIGFKAVFSIARNVHIHSNGFHFGLKDSAPTIPMLGIEENDQQQGTYMIMALKASLPSNLFSKESLLSLCLCLRNIKRITCNDTEIEICDEEGMRKITINGVTYEFEIYRHSFYVNDEQAIRERQHGGRDISPRQTISCYIPVSTQRKAEFYLYSGLPTKIRINIPMYIDAPFELTTSRDYLLENSWNKLIREHVYSAIYEYTSQSREKLLIRSLRFVSVKLQANTYQNNTFEACTFLNSIALNAYARLNVYVPAVNGQLRQPRLTKKYPAFIRRMISTAFGDEPEAMTALNYSDDEYNAPYLFLGGQIAKTEDIMAILQRANLQELLKEENFRKQLYSWLENEKAVSASTAVQSLQIIPVWDTLPNAVRYVAFDGKPVYREHGKHVSSNNDYWVLNEQLMSSTLYTRVLGESIETMDRDHAVQMYKRKLLSFIKPLSAQLTYRHLIQECSTNPLFLEALQTMTHDEQRLLSLQNIDGEIVDSNQVFTLRPEQTVFGRMLRKYIAGPECYPLALSLGLKPLEEIQIGDVEDYKDILTSEDLEDLLKSDSPRIRYGRSIARYFYEEGKVEQKAAEDYGLVFVPLSVETGSWQFPIGRLTAPEKLRNQMHAQLNNAPSIISKVIEKKVRGWISPKDGSFCEFDQRAGRLEQLANYTAGENSDFCFCQMCKKAKKKAYIEVTCIQQEPSRFLPQIYLSLCLECSKRFQGLRAAKKSPFASELYSKIMRVRPNGSGNVVVNMEDNYDLSLTFTETHIAEIQAVLPRLYGSADMQSVDTLSFAREPILNPPEQKSSGTLSDKSTPLTAPAVLGESFEREATDGNSNSNPRVFTVHITGEEAGEYRLVVFSGKLKEYTNHKPEQRFIPLVHQGRDKLMPVSFIKEERTLYVAKRMYATYSKVVQGMPFLAMQKL